MVSRRSFIAAFAAACFFASMGPSRADDSQNAARFIDELAQTAMNTVAVQGIDDAERSRRFRDLFVHYFDLPEIGKFVLGTYWRVATPAQQQEFLALFEEVQVLTWSRRFKDYSGEKLEIVAVTPEDGNKVTVESRIISGRQDPIPVSWMLRRANSGYRVLDIKVTGASMAFTRRSEYASVIRASGGSIDGLLAAMRRQVAQMGGDVSTAAR